MTEGTVILFSASFSLWRLSENKLTMLLLWCFCWGSLLKIFHQCLNEDLLYGMGWKGTKKVTKRATNKSEMLLRSNLGIGLGRETGHGLHWCYDALQSERESGGPNRNPLFQLLCQI